MLCYVLDRMNSDISTSLIIYYMDKYILKNKRSDSPKVKLVDIVNSNNVNEKVDVKIEACLHEKCKTHETSYDS